MNCPSCDSEDFGIAETNDGLMRKCTDCGYLEEPSPSEVALYAEDTSVGWTEEEEQNEGET
jgi:hypothetical protein